MSPPDYPISRVALRSLSRPVVLASVGILLLNDHLLKTAFPGWWTGKLSDFAGLFFFPFLLAVILSPIVEALRWRSPLRVGAGVFVITGAWFACVKATVFGHQAMLGFLTSLLGPSVSIVRDPTDLIALVALLPAWQLWTAECRRPCPKQLGRKPYLAVIFSGIACLATPQITQEVVVGVTSEDDGIRVLVTDSRFVSEDRATLLSAYRSTDNGKTWEYDEPYSSRSDKSDYTIIDAEPVAISPVDPSQWYRVRQSDVVEVSNDGGANWEIAWELPRSRRSYVESAYASPEVLLIGPFDLEFTPDGSGTLIVALGTEGVLVKDPDGNWARRAVGSIEPTPLRVTNPVEGVASLIVPSILLVLLLPYLNLIVGAFVWFSGVKAPGMEASEIARRSLHNPCVSMGVAFPSTLVCALLYFSRPAWLSENGILMAFAGFVIAWAVLLASGQVGWTRYRQAYLGSQGEAICQARRRFLILYIPVIQLPSFLWIMGAIPWLNASRAASVVCFLFLLAHTVRTILLASRSLNQLDGGGEGADEA